MACYAARGVQRGAVWRRLASKPPPLLASACADNGTANKNSNRLNFHTLQSVVEAQRAEHARVEAERAAAESRQLVVSRMRNHSQQVKSTWAAVHAAQTSRGVARTCMACRKEVYSGAVCCMGCHSAWYCGDYCQQQGWKSHAGVCKILQASMKGRKPAVPAAW